MHKLYSYKGFFIFLIAILIFSGFFLFASGHRNVHINPKKVKTEVNFNRITGSEEVFSYVKFRSFQNSDSTWGFTIFVNSRPYIHNKKIPLPSAVTGFRSKKDAENVADLFVKMIKNGNPNPQLNKNTLDSLGIQMKN